MYTFYKDDLIMSVNKNNSDEALRFADKMIARTPDGYWKPHKQDCFKWTYIHPVYKINVENNSSTMKGQKNENSRASSIFKEISTRIQHTTG